MCVLCWLRASGEVVFLSWTSLMLFTSAALALGGTAKGITAEERDFLQYEPRSCVCDEVLRALLLVVGRLCCDVSLQCVRFRVIYVMCVYECVWYLSRALACAAPCNCPAPSRGPTSSSSAATSPTALTSKSCESPTRLRHVSDISLTMHTHTPHSHHTNIYVQSLAHARSAGVCACGAQ